MLAGQQVIQNENQYVVNTYTRPGFVLERGEGVTLYDSEGRAYLDWVAGIAVNVLGYGDPGFAAAITQQLNAGVIHVSNLYHTEPQARLARLLCEKSFADRAYFCNSGAEANEAAIKFARKVAYASGHSDKAGIVTFSGAFHGRTMGALAVTPRDKYQVPFKPLMPGVSLAEFNNIDSARAAINDHTAAVIVEPVQGEGGIYPADPEFLAALRELCDQHDAVLIFDEVQCGLGRTGTLWAHEASGVTPDIMTLAKPLANGLPVGAVLVNARVADAIQPGDHGSTFAGGLMVAAAACYVVETASQPEFLDHVRAVGDYMRERLEELNSPLIREVRGRGLMLALELHVDVADLVTAGFDEGLLLVGAGPRVLRFVPPLIVENAHVDVLIDKLTTLLERANG